MSSVSLRCPFCKQHTAVSPAPLSPFGQPHHDASVAFGVMLVFYGNGGPWWIGQCHACRMPMMVLSKGTRVLPPPQPDPVSDDIPEPMRRDLNEAKSCMTVGAWNAAVVIARRALQSTAAAFGAPREAKLWKQVQWLEEQRFITKGQRSWADAVRWVGNHGAHDNEPGADEAVTDVTEDDAKDAIGLIEKLLEALYVAEAAATEQLAKRGKLKA